MEFKNITCTHIIEINAELLSFEFTSLTIAISREFDNYCNDKNSMAWATCYINYLTLESTFEALLVYYKHAD